MADLKQELAQIQGRLAALKKDCLAKMGEHGGDAVINAGSAVARKLKARPARKLGGHFGKAMSLDFAEGGIMSSVGQDGLLLVWDTWKGCRKAQPITLSSMFAMCTAISTDADVVCAGGLSNVLHVYTLNGPASGQRAGSLVGDFEGHDGYVSCAKFVDKREILSSSGDGTLACWDVSRGAKAPVAVFREHTADVSACDVSSSARDVFASCSTDGTVKFWDKRSGSTTGTVRLSEGDDLSQIGFVPGSSTTVACSVAGEGRGENHGQFLVIDARAMAKLTSFRGTASKRFECTSVAWSGSGRLLFGGTTDDDNPKNLLVFDVNGGKDATQKLKTGDLRTSDVAVSKDGCGVAGANWMNGMSNRYSEGKAHQNISIFS
jgi:guanine nucleotide-binding protein G(I)/G(S)/G(T) subunit beta-1